MVEERKTAAVDERTIAVEEHKKAQQRKLALGHMMEKEPVRRLVENRTVVQVQGMLVQVRTLELELGRMLAQVRMMELELERKRVQEHMLVRVLDKMALGRRPERELDKMAREHKLEQVPGRTIVQERTKEPELKHKLAQVRRLVQLVRKMAVEQHKSVEEPRTTVVEQHKLVEEERSKLAEEQRKLVEERDRLAVGHGRLAEEQLHKRELTERHKKPLVPLEP